MNRRSWLKAIAAAEIAAGLPWPVRARGDEARSGWVAGISAYLATLARPGGGYAWDSQAEAHLTPTFAAIGIHHLLGVDPPDRDALAEFVRTHHPERLKKLEQERREFTYLQIQALAWLGADASSFRDQVRGWTRPKPYLPQYEKHRYPVFRSQLTAFTCRELLGLPIDELTPAFVPYLDARRRENGSFNNTPASDGGDGHVMNTWWGLRALRILGRSAEKRDETVAWLRACQLPGGGFTYRPGADIGGVDDGAYTRAAVRALHLLNAAPADPQQCLAYLASLWNDDGGAGDRPGWPSNPSATYQALDALAALGKLETDRPPIGRNRPRSKPLPPGLKVFSAQIEAHGQGSPADAVTLAGALKIHLWGAKNPEPGWVERAQAIADRDRVPVQFFVSNEEYGTWVDMPGLGTYSHTSDVMAPAGIDFGPSLGDRGVWSWPKFRAKRLEPLQRAGGRLVWQFGENEELVRIFLDDSRERGGYAAISTFHFGNPDFTNTEPFLLRYRGRIPFVALQDAHGDEPWWFADMTTGFRTLFLASEPTWDGWIEALREDRVVAVRHDAVSGFKTWMHGGSPEVLEVVRRDEARWKWWDNPEIRRPLVSLVAVAPGDAFEAARPDIGFAIRVRCAWENTGPGMPSRPLAELESLAVDGEVVAPALVAKKRPNGTGLVDHYHVHPIAQPRPGRHTATAVVRDIRTGIEAERSISFDV
ncbi:prenyltransferase/squalene oxidase repeat-containing protein [Tundrisphaera sp. TA3]|uniref:prenyltransferase/squalene oxidase repeat-containing protein n=1 Tax=Tundrisphaera sp. TA3 TaxID=3435775 RepID=UPI003EBA7487